MNLCIFCSSPVKTAKAPSTSALNSEDPKSDTAAHQNGEVATSSAVAVPASPAKSVHDELGLDEATKRELRLDLGGIEGSIDAAEVRSRIYSQYRMISS